LESWRWIWSELGKLPQILGDCGEQELILCPTRATQSQPAKSEDPLQMGEQHLDPFAIPADEGEAQGILVRSIETTGSAFAEWPGAVRHTPVK